MHNPPDAELHNQNNPNVGDSADADKNVLDDRCSEEATLAAAETDALPGGWNGFFLAPLLCVVFTCFLKKMYAKRRSRPHFNNTLIWQNENDLQKSVTEEEEEEKTATFRAKRLAYLPNPSS